MRFQWLAVSHFTNDDLIRLVGECEKAGFETFWIADERFCMEADSSLAFCSAFTKHIALGPGVTDPYTRHPALTAMAIGTLDHLSGGRAVLGLGAGHSGFHELYLERIHTAQAIRETVQVVRGLLAGERVTMDGKMIKIRDAKLDFSPRGQVPIIVASNGRLVIRVAGEVADGVMSSSVLIQPRIDEVLKLVEEGLQISGRKRLDFTVWSRLNIIIHPDRQKALQAPKPSVYGLITGRYPDMSMFEHMGLFLPDDLRHTVETVGYTRDKEKLSWIIKQIPDEFVEKTCLVGTPSEIVDKLRNLEAAGFDGVALYPIPVEGQTVFDVLKVVVEEIIPATT